VANTPAKVTNSSPTLGDIYGQGRGRSYIRTTLDGPQLLRINEHV